MSCPGKSDRLRIVQWATGTVGAAAMRAVLDHPDLELVGVRVYSAAKEGKDAGELCGRPHTGIKAVRDLQSILALKPDCVLYMPESTNLEDVCALLESGVNISSTRAEFFHPASMEPRVRARIEAACIKGNSSLHVSGSSPGFITEALPIVLLSLARRLDLLTIDEFADCTDGCSEEMLLGVMGFGESPEAFAGRPFYERDEVFGRSLRALADAVGIEIERFETSSEVAVARGCLAGLPRAASVTTAPRRVGARADARHRNRPGRLPESPAGRHGRHPPRDGHWCA